jgi:hypothetical protein
MNAKAVEQQFKDKVSAALRIEGEGHNRFRVFTPFTFDDGDHLSVLLKNDHERWVLSDEGSTLFHLK